MRRRAGLYPRWIRPRIERALLDTPAVFVAGHRQSGKSTLVRLIRQDGYVTLDRATVRAGAGSDPDGFVAGLPVPVALDEVQRVADLLLAVKAEIDEQRQPSATVTPTVTERHRLAPIVTKALFGSIPPGDATVHGASKLHAPFRRALRCVDSPLGRVRAWLDPRPLITARQDRRRRKAEAAETSGSRIRPGLAHFRTRSGDEVDLVMEARDGTVVGVEEYVGGTSTKSPDPGYSPSR